MTIVERVRKASGALGGKRYEKPLAWRRVTVKQAGRMVLTLTPIAASRLILAKAAKLATTVTATYVPPEGGESESIVRNLAFEQKDCLKRSGRR